MSDKSGSEMAQDVAISDESTGYKAGVTSDRRLMVDDGFVLPTPPPGGVQVIIGGYTTIANNKTVDVLYTITNGKTLYLQLMKARGAGNSTSGNLEIAIFEDPNGNLSVLNRIDTVFISAQGSNFDTVQGASYVGNGTRRILLRSIANNAQFTTFRQLWGYEI